MLFQGTWQFMSALLQQQREKRHHVSDDLESFMHVLNWCALRHLPNGLSDDPPNLRKLIWDHFHSANMAIDANGNRTGHRADLFKLMGLKDGRVFAIGVPQSHPFAALLERLAHLCRDHYAHFNILQAPPPPHTDDPVLLEVPLRIRKQIAALNDAYPVPPNKA